MNTERSKPFPGTICPVMSRAANIALCRGDKCAWWIEVYTTELNRVYGCAKALQPCMHEGLFRV